MSDSDARGLPAGQHGDEEGDYEQGAWVRRRVIGTPPPAQERELLGPSEDGAEEPSRVAPRQLPPDPDNPVKAKKAERLVATCFIIATLASIGFIAFYVMLDQYTVNGVAHSNLALGSTMALAFLAMGIGATIWVRHLMPQVELTEERHPLASDPKDREAFKETFEDGAQASQFVSRPLVRRTLIAATVPLAAAPLVLLRDMGPLPGTSLDYTVWRPGMRLLTYGSNRPLTPAEFNTPGAMITMVPDGFQDNDDVLAKATVIIIKFAPGELVFGAPWRVEPGKVVPNWTVDGIVAYSKICTHLGCPAALYEQTTQHILCPCHQSTFDAPRGAEVLFGPATRPLPQLPMTVNAQGQLVARGDFHEPVGPSFWERS
jgi:ubiquinol-cytochrome c reductase iron-sulfur subunit